MAVWFDLSRSQLPLVTAGVTGRERAAFATSAALRVLVPATAGTLRIRRADIG